MRAPFPEQEANTAAETIAADMKSIVVMDLNRIMAFLLTDYYETATVPLSRHIYFAPRRPFSDRPPTVGPRDRPGRPLATQGTHVPGRSGGYPV
jgi:hypothetical protein